MAEIKRMFWRARMDLKSAEEQRHFLLGQLREAGVDPDRAALDEMREAWIEEGPPDEVLREMGLRP